MIEENTFYIDRTIFIDKLEAVTDRNLFFLRPRKFGKSLFLLILEYDYRIPHKERFEELFGECHISMHSKSRPLQYGY